MRCALRNAFFSIFFVPYAFKTYTAFCSVINWAYVAQRFMWAVQVVILQELIAEYPGLMDALKEVCVQDILPVRTIKSLDISVRHGLPWLYAH